MAISSVELEEYVGRVLPKINPNHSFLRKLVSMGLILPNNFWDNPESLTTREAINLVDEQISYPNPKHHALVQAAWIDEHKFLLGIERGREVSDVEAQYDFDNVRDLKYGGLTGRERYEVFYSCAYLKPAMISKSIESRFLTWAETRYNNSVELYDRLWTEDANNN
jgi:hypothetical protein